MIDLTCAKCGKLLLNQIYCSSCGSMVVELQLREPVIIKRKKREA